jgi:exosome complex component RRP43
MCSSKFRPGPPGDEAQVLSNRIRNIALAYACLPLFSDGDADTLSRRSRLLPLHTLCIKPGKAVWVLYADIICINYDGNVTDAAVLALVAALRNSKLGSTSV